MRKQILSLANNERGPRYFEKALASIHQSCRHGDRISFEYTSTNGNVGLFVQAADELASRVVQPIIASYPHCSVRDADISAVQFGLKTWTAELTLVPDLFPILRHAQFEDLLNRNVADPIAGILRAIRPEQGIECCVQILVTPARHRLRHRAIHAVRTLDREFFRHYHRLAAFYSRNSLRGISLPVAKLLGIIATCSPHARRDQLDTSSSRQHDREADLQAASEKIGAHLFEARILLCVSGSADQHRESLDRIREIAGAFGTFAKSRLATFFVRRIGGHALKTESKRRFLLSHEELATLFHPPMSTVAAERLQSNEFVELEAPAAFHSEKERGSIVLGRVKFREDHRPAVLGLEDRRRHIYIVGKTGMGKTTLIQNMIVSDMQAGAGICLVDPHGDLAESIVGLVPKHRTNDTIIFDAGDPTAVIPFNPLACRDASRIDQVTSGVVSAFKKLHDSWGPRLEDTLRNAVYATVEQGGNLMSVMRLLGERSYREHVVPRIRDEVVRSFWLNEFASWSDNYRTEAVAAIQNKIRPFVTNTIIRAIVSHPGRSLDLRQIMDEGRLLIINLSKGRLGEDNSTLLGAFFVTSIQQAAMTRADIPESGRRDFFLYVDEFQNFTTGSFASVVSEARKYRLSLCCAHQHLSQLNEETAQAVWGNVGSLVAFQVGSADAEILARQLVRYYGQVAPENLTGLPKYTAYARLLIDGMPSSPFSMQTLPPPDANEERAITVRSHSSRLRRNMH